MQKAMLKRTVAVALIGFVSCIAAWGQRSPKPILAILPFTGSNLETRRQGDALSMYLSQERAISDEFALIPRTRISTRILDEVDFQQKSGLTDSDTAKSIGRQLNAQYVVGGSVQALGTQNLVIVTIIDVETLEQIAGHFVIYGELGEVIASDKGKPKITEIAEKLANGVDKIKNRRRRLPPSLAILPFGIPTDEGTRKDAKALSDILAIEIMNTEEYRVFLREKAIEAVMEEQDIQDGDLTDPSSIKAINKAVNTDYVLAGEVVTAIPPYKDFMAFVLDVEYGTQDVAGRVSYNNLEDGKDLMKELAKQLQQ